MLLPLPPMDISASVRPPTSHSRRQNGHATALTVQKLRIMKRSTLPCFTICHVRFWHGHSNCSRLVTFAKTRKNDAQRNTVARSISLPLPLSLHVQNQINCVQRMEIELKFHPIASLLLIFCTYFIVAAFLLSVSELYGGCCITSHTLTQQSTESVSVFFIRFPQSAVPRTVCVCEMRVHCRRIKLEISSEEL